MFYDWTNKILPSTALGPIVCEEGGYSANCKEIYTGKNYNLRKDLAAGEPELMMKCKDADTSA